MTNPTPSLFTNTIPLVGNAINESGGSVTPGQLLYINGVEPAGFTVGLASNDTASAYAALVALSPAADEGVLQVAPLDQALTGVLDTHLAAVGAPVYLSTGGAMTLTPPTGNTFVQIVGYVSVVSATVGVVQLLPSAILKSVGSAQQTSGSTGFAFDFAEYSASGAIAIPAAPVLAVRSLLSAGPLSMTLALPSAGQEGTVMIITAETAQAHVVLAAGGDNAFNNVDLDTATFGGAIGDSMVLVAINGHWNVVTLTNVVLSDAV